MTQTTTLTPDSNAAPLPADKIIVGTIGSPMSSLRNAVGNLATQIQKNQANRVQTFTAYVQAKPKEKITDAQYIEDLRLNQDRLNLFSSMPKGDNQDYYKFNLNFSGSVHFSKLTDLIDDKGNVLKKSTAQGLDVQIIQMHGNTQVVVADSNPSSGDNYKNFQQLQQDGLNMTAGKYVIKVNRDATASADANYFYSFQLAGDRYYQDFDTVQSPAPQTHGVSLLSFLQPDAVTGLMAASLDATSALAGQASMPVNGASLSANTGTQTNPAVQFLSMFA